MVEGVLPDLDYVQLIFTLPKIFRKAFLFRRSLVSELSRVAYAALKPFFQEHFPGLTDPVPAVVIAPQSFGSLLNPNIHLHSLCCLGVFDRQGNFHPGPRDLEFSPLEKIFRELTFKMMLEVEAISAERVAMMRNWAHSGFNLNTSRTVPQGDRVAKTRTLRRITRGQPALRTLREIMDEVYRLFDRRCRTDTALQKLGKLRARVRRFKTVGKKLQKLFSPSVDKALTFLDEKLLPSTSNAVERGNRRHRKMQKTVYRVRAMNILKGRIALDMLRDEQAERRLGTVAILHSTRSGCG